MKKIFALPVAALVLLLSNCQKKAIQPKIFTDTSYESSNHQAPVSLTELKKNFKHEQTIRVYDVNDIHFVDITVKSENEANFNSACAYIRNSKMELLSKPIGNSTLTNQVSSSFIGDLPGFEKDFVLIELGKAEKGNAFGYHLVQDRSNGKETTVVGFNYSTIYHVGFCSQYSVRELVAHTIIASDYYVSGGSQVFNSSQTIGQYGYWAFGGVGYSDHYCYLNKWSHSFLNSVDINVI